MQGHEWIGLFTLTLAAACAAGDANVRSGSASPSDDGGGASGLGGGLIAYDGSAPLLEAGAPRSNLPVPWQYYNQPGDRAFKDATLPAGIKDQFGGAAAASGQPQIVYPLDGSMHPMNLADITLQWKQGAATSTVFRIDAVVGTDKYRFFVPCQKADCTYPMPASEWLDLGATHAGQQVSFTISGTDGIGGPVATSSAIEITYSPGALHGALYYWAEATEEIKRADFGAKKALPFISPNSSTNEFGCVGCHSLSRDGKVMAYAVCEKAGEASAGIQVAPTEDPAQPYVRPTKGTTPFPPKLVGDNTVGPTNDLGQSVTLNPDGTMAAVVGLPGTAPLYNWPPFFELRNARTGAMIKRWDLGDPLFGDGRIPILPEWSPDGTAIVATLAYTDIANCTWGFGTCKSDIVVLPVQNGTLGQPRVLVENSATAIHFYPSWSPDGKYVAFVSAKFAPPDQSRSYSNKNGLLRLVPAEGGPYACPGDSCWELASGTQYSVAEAAAGQGRQSTWPKFTPFAQGPRGNVMFISFNSRIDYGFLAKDSTQIWMFAIDTDKLVKGQDPSFAPIWLPYQDFTDTSLSPIWTQTLPCQKDPNGGCKGCLAGESCVVDSDNQCGCTTIIN